MGSGPGSEMPKSCAARQCCNRYSNRRKQLTFHRFPFSRPELLKEWVLNLGRADFEPKQHTVICSEHFRPECFSAFGNRKNLKHNAVPTVFASRDPVQLAGGTEPGDGDAGGELQVRPEVGAGRASPGRSMEAALGEHHLPPTPEGPSRQVLPPSLEAPGPAGQKRPRPKWPSDHSYALLDLDTLKKKLFLTLKENEKLRRRLRAQRRVMRGLSSRLRARGEGRQPEPGL